jgi:UDP:flavonoid glycosyltransferase YjiC (YdhE family)
MIICILIIGTHGGVQPYITLGSGLMQGEHEVAIATLGEFQSRVSGHGSQHAVTDPDIRRRAVRLGETIRAEYGVGRAVEIIQSRLRE